MGADVVYVDAPKQGEPGAVSSRERDLQGRGARLGRRHRALRSGRPIGNGEQEGRGRTPAARGWAGLSVTGAGRERGRTWCCQLATPRLSFSLPAALAPTHGVIVQLH